MRYLLLVLFDCLYMEGILVYPAGGVIVVLFDETD